MTALTAPPALPSGWTTFINFPKRVLMQGFIRGVNIQEAQLYEQMVKAITSQAHQQICVFEHQLDDHQQAYLSRLAKQHRVTLKFAMPPKVHQLAFDFDGTLH